MGLIQLSGELAWVGDRSWGVRSGGRGVGVETSGVGLAEEDEVPGGDGLS